MRKVSKNRADDEDIASATNGSVNDDQPNENITPDEKEPDADSEANDNESSKVNNDNELDNSEDVKPKKKQAIKKKVLIKKRKSTREIKKVEEEYEVEKIVDEKKIKGKVHYLVRWKGYSASSDTWEPEDTVSCSDLIAKFKGQNKTSNTKDKKFPVKKAEKRSLAKNNDKVASKKPKTEWDSENADENAEYEVEHILEVHQKKNGKREFLIHWKGWSKKFDSWEPESNLHCPDLIKKFVEKSPVRQRKTKKSK